MTVTSTVTGCQGTRRSEEEAGWPPLGGQPNNGTSTGSGAPLTPGRTRRPALAGPAARLPPAELCRGPAPRLRRTSNQNDAPPRPSVDARAGNEQVTVESAATSASIAAATRGSGGSTV